jgi:NAD+ kinase
MKTVGIIANPQKDGIPRATGMVRSWAEAHGLSLVVDDLAAKVVADDLATAPRGAVAERSDLVIAFGGDGTMLAAVRGVAEAGRPTPVLGVNLGSLGFLTQVPGDELQDVLRTLDPGDLPVAERMMLEVASGDEGPKIALNDVVILKAADARMLSFEARSNGELVTRYAADGLILSTPTGSTAYSVSAGGPVVVPGVEAIIATPICPHTLSIRACVVPPDSAIEVEMLQCGGGTTVTADGERAFLIEEEDVVTVRRSDRRALLVDVGGHSYYEILRLKMRWAGRVRER